MKLTRFINATLLTSVTLFTACSSSTPKPKVSTLSIIGVHTGSDESIAALNEDALPMARTYPIINEVYRTPQYYQPTRNVRRAPYVSRPPIVNVHSLEENAKRLLGIKYVWGATGPYTYDCSGFTQKIYRDAGINIPRVSRDQARVGQYISFEDLRKGDMVFFDTKKKRTGIVSHVGIYLGAGNFIHASSAAKKIVIYNFYDKSFYKERFLWGRRVINDNYHMASL